MSSSDSDSDAEAARGNMITQFMAVNSARKRTSPPSKRPQETVTVEVPQLQNEDEYEFFPDYAQVDFVIDLSGEMEDSDEDAFEVRLSNGDIEVYPEDKILCLLNGPRALADFKQSAGGPRRRGTRRNKTVLSSDEEVSARRSRRSARQVATKRQAQLVDLNDSDLDIGSGPIRRSRRLVSQVNLVSDNELTDESEESMPRKRRRTEARPALAGSKAERKLATHPKLVQATRSSERSRKTTVNFTERTEDDIPEFDAKTAGTRYSSTKERFEKRDKDDPFRLRHKPSCDTCTLRGDDEVKGPLVFCQGCTSSYHRECLGPRTARPHLVTKIHSGAFILQCRRCIGLAREKDPLAPHLGHCSNCNQPGPWSLPVRSRLTTRQEHLQREENGGNDPVTNVDLSTVDSVDNVMFRCSGCERAWHAEHLPLKISRLSHIEDSGDDQATRFKEYARRWKCNECSKAPGEIETLVAWRPTDLDAYIPGSSSDMIEEIKKEYLVKWRKLSYFKASWMPGAWVWGTAAAATRKAFNQSSKSQKPMTTSEDAIPEEYLQIDIVFDVRYSNLVSNRTQAIDMQRAKEVESVYAKYKGLQYEDAVWDKPPSPLDEERWQSFRSAYEDWVLGRYMRVPKASSLKKNLSAVRAKNFERDLVKHKQPSTLTGGTLMEYQKDGLNWLYYMWYKEQNAILADEMGLGKTIQVISLFATLIQDHHCFPFLVVVPNSTCQNWRNEVKTWAPGLRVVTYYGTSAARKIAHDYELFPEGASDVKAHIVVTSYETMSDDRAKGTFRRIPWAGLVVDEGHRLKNDKNQLYGALEKINFPFKLLLTGTPLQNNVRELFNILQFIDSSKNAEELDAEYQNLDSEKVTELHDMIRPFFLRRTKAQVLTFLPPMAQVIVPVSMTTVQKKLYKSILAKNPLLIKAVFKNGASLKKTERHNLNNMLMQLRKCLCHPYVYSKAIEERDVNATLLHRNLVEASSKLQLLEILLPKLQERGHRVLIFSQFLDFLDIIEDFLDGLGLLHLRLDGSISSLQKQKQMDDYNAPNSPYFAFLLSTRAGGVGINLATADTVVIMDPDFNPHQDIQALSRAHRIGQQKKVLVFQLMTRESAEEKIMQVGRKKMALDHVLIERMDAEDDAGEDLESILRHGAQALFDNDTSADIHYDSQSVENLLDRSHMENTKTGNDSSAESQFSFARVWTNNSTLEDNLESSETATPNDDSLWDKILQQRERAAAEEARVKAENLGRGKRKRHAVDYALPDTPARSSGKDREDNDDEFQGADEDSFSTDMDSQEDGAVSDHSANLSKRARPYKRATVPPLGSRLDNVDGPSSDVTNGVPQQRQRCPACDELHQQGHCRLKLAGVEHCGLCGIAHFGYSRTCPHLNSESQVAAMLGSLKQSPEPRALVAEATRYLRGIRGDLVRRKKVKAMKAKGSNPPEGNTDPHTREIPAHEPPMSRPLMSVPRSFSGKPFPLQQSTGHSQTLQPEQPAHHRYPPQPSSGYPYPPPPSFPGQTYPTYYPPRPQGYQYQGHQ